MPELPVLGCECGWQGKKPAQKTVRKVKVQVCPDCNGPVAAVPLNRQTGRCHECGGGSYRLKYVNRKLIRECNSCGVWFDVEKNEAIEKGSHGK